MKNKRKLFSIVLFFGVLFLLMIYFSRNNTSKSIIESKQVSEDAQTEAQHRIDTFLNSKVKPSTNVTTASDITSNEYQQLDVETKDLIAEEEALVQECRGRSDGGSPETTKICAQMMVAFNKLISLGLCYGENSETMSEKRWEKCRAVQKSTQGSGSEVNAESNATEQELQDIKPYIYAAETLNKTCLSALNGTIEKIQVCNARDNAVERLKHLGWCWEQDSEIVPYKNWVKCDKEQNSNAVELQNNSASTPQIANFDAKNGTTTSEAAN